MRLWCEHSGMHQEYGATYLVGAKSQPDSSAEATRPPGGQRVCWATSFLPTFNLACNTNRISLLTLLAEMPGGLNAPP